MNKETIKKKYPDAIKQQYLKENSLQLSQDGPVTMRDSA